MCCATENNGEKAMEKKFRLANFFDQHWDKYMESPASYVKAEQLKAVNALRVCRTERLGIDIYACPDCGEEKRIYHNCKNRFCPTCSWKDTMEWAERIRGRMLRVKHRHIVCTLPHSIHPLIRKNKVLLDSLMRAAAFTFKDWMRHRYQIKIGIICVLHTYGEKKNYHPHVHMIVSWGGTTKKKTLKEIENEFVNYKFLQKKFRINYEKELIEFYDRGQLVSSFSDRASFLSYVKQINLQDWQLHLEPAIQTPAEVIRYIGRYSKRACISEYKITGMEGEHISFQYKDYRDRDAEGMPKIKELTLHYRKFFPRLLQHVPPPYFRVVRYYGLYSNHGHIDPAYLNRNEEEEIELNKESNQCELCLRKRIYVYTYLDQRSKKQQEFNRTEKKYTKYKKTA
jgi:Putative transposase/Transposase zinc-binding domain